MGGGRSGTAAGPARNSLSTIGLHGVASAEAACVAAAGDGEVTGSTAYPDGTAAVLGGGTTGRRWVCDAVVAGSGWTLSMHPAR